MDGNRRWAKRNLLSTFLGHQNGFDVAKNMIEHIAQMKKEITHLTLWALSKENILKRSAAEVEGIIKLIHKFEDFLPDLMKNSIVFQVIGDFHILPQKTVNMLQNLIEKTKENAALVVRIAIGYSGQDEIVRATKKIISEKKDPNTLDEETFREYLDFPAPYPDLIIRTGGYMRHSGFMLYESAYSEYYFTEKYWPEFTPEELQKALDFFQSTQRNF